MVWFVLIAVAGAAAGVLRSLLKRQSRNRDSGLSVDSPAQGGFYPEIEKCHEINTRSITCSCTDFRKEREQFRHDDPRRLCKHLVKSFVDADSLPEDLAFFRQGIQLSAESHSGFPSNRRRFDRICAGRRISLMVPQEITEEEPWIDVYAESGRYRYSPGLGRWAEEKTPPQEGEIIRFVYEKMGQPVPESIRTRMKIPSHGPLKRKRTEGISAAPGISEELKALDGLLRTVLPPGKEIAYRETLSYVAATLDGPRKWLCRIYVRSGRSRRIEFCDGTKYEFNSAEDIVKYRGKLLDAYRTRISGKMKTNPLFPMRENALSPHNTTSVEGRDDVQSFSQN